MPPVQEMSQQECPWTGGKNAKPFLRHKQTYDTVLKHTVSVNLSDVLPV